MCNSNTSGRLRIAAGIMGLMMLFILLFSAFYISAEAGHDCAGEDCPICACIRQCENTLRGIGGTAAAQFSFIVPILFILLTAGIPCAAVSQDTLVSAKVRLNN